MRRTYYFLGLCAAVVAVSLVLVFRSRAAQPPSDGLTSALPTDTVSVGEAESVPSVRVDPTFEDVAMDPEPLTIEREAITAPEPEVVTDDPCASVTAELNAARAELDKARAELEQARKEISLMSTDLAYALRERDRCDPSTPLGAFFASPEAEAIKTRDQVYRLESWLTEFPVFLQPAERAWLVERVALDDWGAWFPGSCGEVIVQFLGPERLARELPPEKLADLRMSYPEFFDD